MLRQGWLQTLLFLSAALSGCGAPPLDIDTEEGRSAIYDAVNIALTHGECDHAIELIQPLYNSKYANNRARLLFASAHGCKAGINYFPFLASLGEATVSNGGLWTLLTSLFQYSDLAGLDSGWRASAALQASLSSPNTVPASYRFNSNTFNMGSIYASDRTDDANSYLMFIAMAVIGRTQYRNGAPNSTYHKTQSLPWTTAAGMNTEGCQYASAIVNMVDAIDSTASQASGSVKTVLLAIASTYKTSLRTACENGCTNMGLTGCSFGAGSCTASGSFCPLELRYAGNCQPVTTNIASCAAAGVVNFINTDAILGWQ